MFEYWDIYDERRFCTGRVHRRGIPLSQGDYHLVVEIWTRVGDKVLLTQRHPDKHFPLMWECTGGSVVSGEDTFKGAIREMKEETGIEVQPEHLKLIDTVQRRDTFYDIYLYTADLPYPEIILQEGETVDYMWCTETEIDSMIERQLLAGSLAEKFSKLRHVIF